MITHNDKASPCDPMGFWDAQSGGTDLGLQVSYPTAQLLSSLYVGFLSEVSVNKCISG
jgi:hypothetical protein